MVNNNNNNFSSLFDADRLGVLIKSVLKALTLIDITATAMYAAYSTMHQSTMGPYTVLEHWIITSVLRLIVAFMNVLAFKIPIAARSLCAIAVCIVPFLLVYDSYMLQLVTSSKTYLITTIAMKTIFIALDVVLLVVLFYVSNHPDEHWRYYVKTHDDTYSVAWDLPKAKLDATKYKDRNLMGMAATVLPIHVTALVFYIMSQLSNGKTEISGYIFFYDIVIIIFVSDWFGRDVDEANPRSVQAILQLYVNTGIIIFIGFILYVFQLTLIPIDFMGLVVMRMTLFLISGVYLSLFIVKNYDTAFSGVDRSYMMYLVVSFGFFSLSTFEFFSMIGYTLYSSVVRNQHLIVSNYFHILTSSAAAVIFFIAEGDMDEDKWRFFSSTFSAGSLAVWCNVLLVSSIFNLYSDTVAIGIFPSQPYRTTAEFWMQVGFVVTSAAYVLMLMAVYPIYSRRVFVHEYKVFVDMMADKFSYMVMLSTKYQLCQLNFIMRRLVLFVSYVEYVFVTYFVYCLVDTRVSILGHIIHNHDWAIVVHYITVAIAWLTSFVYVDIRTQCGLVLASAAVSLLVDSILIGVSVTQALAQPESLLFLRIALVFVDASYIVLCIYGLSGTDEYSIEKEEEKEKEKEREKGKGKTN